MTTRAVSSEEEGLQAKAEVQPAKRIPLACTLLGVANGPGYARQKQGRGNVTAVAGQKVPQKRPARRGGSQSSGNSGPVNGVVRITEVEGESGVGRAKQGVPTLRVDQKLTATLDRNSKLHGRKVRFQGRELRRQEGTPSNTMVSRANSNGAQLHHTIGERNVGIKEGAKLAFVSLEEEGESRSKMHATELRGEAAEGRRRHSHTCWGSREGGGAKADETVPSPPGGPLGWSSRTRR